MSKKIYICGKISGLDQWEVTMKFEASEYTMQRMGYTVVNPVKLVNNMDATWLHAMKLCLPALLECDAIYIQDDWQTSRGARIEIATAAGMGLQMLMEDPSQSGEVHRFVRLMDMHRQQTGMHINTSDHFLGFM